jgi:excisionase family DNA binding protein
MQIGGREALNVGQAAEHLEVCTGTVYAWIEERRLPYYKVGRRVWFDPEDLKAFIAKGRVGAEVA